MVKVGLETGSRTPRARAAPRTNVVFPAPSSPETRTTSPGRSRAASRAASASVSAGEFVVLCKDVTIGAGAACASSRTVPGTDTRRVTEACRFWNFSFGADRVFFRPAVVFAPSDGARHRTVVGRPRRGFWLQRWAGGSATPKGGTRPRGKRPRGARPPGAAASVASVLEAAP